jgi:hypothetical protein
MAEPSREKMAFAPGQPQGTQPAVIWVLRPPAMAVAGDPQVKRRAFWHTGPGGVEQRRE